MTLTPEQLNQILLMTAPQLDIGAGAVSDLLGNAIVEAPDGRIAIIFDPMPAGNLGDDGTRLLDGAQDVKAFRVQGGIYAAVAASGNDGIQIVNITDPANPRAAGHLSDNSSLLLSNPSLDIFQTGGRVYAAAASVDDNGIQIVNITDPANPQGVGQLADNSTLLLSSARGVDAFETGGSAYAAVSSFGGDGIQIVNITDPANPQGVGMLSDSSAMDRARGVAVFNATGGVYAAVASKDGGFQTVNITDPADPVRRRTSEYGKPAVFQY